MRVFQRFTWVLALGLEGKQKRNSISIHCSSSWKKKMLELKKCAKKIKITKLFWQIDFSRKINPFKPLICAFMYKRNKKTWPCDTCFLMWRCVISVSESQIREYHVSTQFLVKFDAIKSSERGKMAFCYGPNIYKEFPCLIFGVRALVRM